MRRSLHVLVLTLLMMMAFPGFSRAASKAPTNEIFPRGISNFKSQLSVAKAFGQNIGISSKAPYYSASPGKDVGPGWIEVVTNGPTYVSYIQVEEVGGSWYVVKMTSPIIAILTPKDGSRVGLWTEVHSLGISTVKYFATSTINHSALSFGATLSKSEEPYAGRITSIGPNNEVGVYSGKIRSGLIANEQGWIMVAALSPNGDGILAAAIVHTRR